MTADGAIGEAINLGHNEPVAVSEMIALLEAALGGKATIEHRPANSADLAVTCADLTKARRCWATNRKSRWPMACVISRRGSAVTWRSNRTAQKTRPADGIDCSTASRVRSEHGQLSSLYFSPINFATLGSIDAAQISYPAGLRCK